MEEEEITTTTRKPAWVDEDDENIRVTSCFLKIEEHFIYIITTFR